LVKIPAEDFSKFTFSENLAPIKFVDTSGIAHFGFINNLGLLKISAFYDTITSVFNGGFAVVGKKKSPLSHEIFYGLINNNGAIIVPFSYRKVLRPAFNYNIVPVLDIKNNWGFYDVKGNFISQPLYEQYSILEPTLIAVSNMGKWGLINGHGKVIKELKYKSIKKDASNRLVLQTLPTYYLRNGANKIIKALACDSFISIDKDFYKYFINGKIGLAKGKKEISAKYDKVTPYNKSIYLIQQDSKYGIVDTALRYIFQAEYDSVLVTKYGYFIYTTVSNKRGNAEKRWSLVGFKKEVVIPPIYKGLTAATEPPFALKDATGYYGYINIHGDTIIKPRYETASPFKNGTAMVTYSDSCGKNTAVINSDNHLIAQDNYLENYKKGFNHINSKKELDYNFPLNKYLRYRALNSKIILAEGHSGHTILHRSGAELATAVKNMIFTIDPDIIIVYNDTATGIIADTGRVILPLTSKYDSIFPFSDGFARVKKNGKFGCIDLNNNKRISCQYPDMKDFHGGHAPVLLLGKWGYINKEEEFAVQPYYKAATLFAKDAGAVKLDNGKWNTVNKKGTLMNMTEFDSIKTTVNNKFLLHLNGKVGMAGTDGVEIIGARYDNIEDLSDDYMKIFIDGKIGVIDIHQRVIVPLQEKPINFDRISTYFVDYQKNNVEYLK
jgi:hypothetical protein